MNKEFAFWGIFPPKFSQGNGVLFKAIFLFESNI